MKPRKRSTAPPPERAERATEFTRILERLIDLEPTVLAAVLVDNEGEAIDYAGALSSFDTKIAGAHLRIVLDQLTGVSARAKVGRLSQVLVRGVRRSFVIRPLDDGYALILVLKRQGFAISPRALAIAERDLYREAGWSLPSARPAWYPVHVETAFRNRRRPLRMLAGATWQRIEVLGRVMGLGRELGFRCRLRSGAELTLVREPAGAWYADELVDETASD